MTCDEAKLSEYFDNELAPDERRIVEHHIDSCPTCRLTLGSFARVRTSMKAYKAPEEIVAVLQERLLAQRGIAVRQRRMRRLAWTAAAALAATVIVVLASVLGSRDSGDSVQLPPVRDIATANTPEPPPILQVPKAEETPSSPPTPPAPEGNAPVEAAAPEQPASREETYEPRPDAVPEKPVKKVPSPERMVNVEKPKPAPVVTRVRPPKVETQPVTLPAAHSPEPPSEETGHETVPDDTPIPVPQLPQESAPPPLVPAQPETELEAPSVPHTRMAMVELKLELPQPFFGGTPLDYFSPNLEENAFKARSPLLVPEGTRNLARGKAVISSDNAPRLGELSFVTDGEKGYQKDYLLELGAGVQWVQIDLEKTSAIYAIVLWHFHANNRVYFDVVVQVSDDPGFTGEVTTIYNNDIDNSAGLGVGKDKEYVETYEGRLIDAKGAKGRYVRLYSRGNTTDKTNHYTEVEVFGIPYH
ncbi:MAG: zf-HC2 domain-containing protein [Candidatus Hydrogenedentes bacterium]|nr:zf-HC2 domain-containing protein [Candidatus Hydrogenedentota bacterium]